MKYRGREVCNCTCGAAEEGHAPDCRHLQACDEVEERYQEDHREVARSFCNLIAECLAAEQMHEVVARNAAETNPNVCHTHDFCDANLLMVDALKGQGLSSHIDDGYSHAVWDGAWSLAKAVGFESIKIV